MVLKTCISQGGGSSLGIPTHLLSLSQRRISPPQVARPPSSRCDQVPGGPEKRQQAHNLKDQREGSSLVVQWLGLGAFTGVRSLAGELRSRKLCSPVGKKKRPEGHVYMDDPHTSSSRPMCPTTTLPSLPEGPPATPQLRRQKVNSSPHCQTSSFLCLTWLVVSTAHHPHQECRTHRFFHIPPVTQSCPYSPSGPFCPLSLHPAATRALRALRWPFSLCCCCKSPKSTSLPAARVLVLKRAGDYAASLLLLSMAPSYLH